MKIPLFKPKFYNIVLSLLLLFLVSTLSASENYFLNEGRLSEPLIELLRLDGLYEEGDGLYEAVEKTQKKWLGVLLGQNNKERIDLIDPPEWVAIREKVVGSASTLGITLAKSRARSEYDYAFLYGAFLTGMRYRLHEILEAWEEGVRFKELVVLTGDRPLRMGIGQPDALDDLIPTSEPKNEADLAELLIEQTALPKEIKVTLVRGSKIEGNRTSMRDNLKEWLLQNPLPGTIFAPTHPLLFVYQDLVAKSVLPQGYSIDTVAKSYVPKGGNVVSLIFDTIAKSLFEIKIKYSKPD